MSQDMGDVHLVANNAQRIVAWALTTVRQRQLDNERRDQRKADMFGQPVSDPERIIGCHPTPENRRPSASTSGAYSHAVRVQAAMLS